MEILELPTDILLHLFSYLDVRDIVSLRKTCKAFDAVTRDRSVWHEALLSRFICRGIPVVGYPIHEHNSTTGMSAETLEQIVIRAQRFWSNWTSLEPTPFRQVEIQSTHHPWSIKGARNLAAEFLPGHRGRYLLTLTLHDSFSERDTRRFSFECWDIGGPKPTLLAELHIASLLGYAVNSTASSPHMLAICRRESGRLTTTTYTIDFSQLGVSPWFRRMGQFETSRKTLGLQGPYYLATDAGREVYMFHVDSGHLVYKLKVPLLHDDQTLHLPEFQCIDFEIIGDFILTFCRQWIFLYYVPAPPSLSPTAPYLPERAIDPIVKFKWQWRIDSVSVATRRHPPSSSFPIIDLLIRFDTYYPWPVNILHHFVLPPNPEYAPDGASFSPSDPTTFPYLPFPTDPSAPLVAGAAPGRPDAHHAHPCAPRMAHAIPSPLRLFTPSDMVLGACGTALWLDAAPDAASPAQAGDRGQRIAALVVARGPLPAHAGPAPGDDAVSPGMGAGAATEAEGEGEEDAARVSEMLEAEAAPLGRARVSVLHAQETHEVWSRVAVCEEQGLVAVGQVDGKVSVYEYAPL